MASTTNDLRLTEVEEERKDAIADSEKLYGDMVSASDSYYQAQIDASKEWEATQKANQQAQTDFAIEQINQQKEQTQKDYTKEQSGAYVDWQKESNRYGANAEELAEGGMLNTGYGESSQVRIYNTYQNRVATAREAYNRAVINYDNAIKDAQLQNNSILAEIAFNALQQQLELSLQGFQYKNQLLTESANKKLEINRTYDSKYQAVLDQINEENRLAEQIRQFNAEQAWLKEKAEIEAALERERLALQYGDKEEDTTTESDKTAEELAGAEAFRDSITGTYLVSPTAKKVAEMMKKAGTMLSAAQQSVSEKTHQQKLTNAEMKMHGHEIETPYYKGSLNSDAKKYGTFSNGYQPKGISGHGLIAKTGDSYYLETKTLSGEVKTVKQNVWIAEDGTKWYWEGRENKYKLIK